MNNSVSSEATNCDKGRASRHQARPTACRSKTPRTVSHSSLSASCDYFITALSTFVALTSSRQLLFSSNTTTTSACLPQHTTPNFPIHIHHNMASTDEQKIILVSSDGVNIQTGMRTRSSSTSTCPADTCSRSYHRRALNADQEHDRGSRHPRRGAHPHHERESPLDSYITSYTH